MKMRSFAVLTLLAVAGSLGLARELAAQTPDDFLLKRPNGTLTIRGGYALPSENSDIFSFVQEQLTVDEGDFAGVVFGFDLAYRLSERLDLAMSLEHSRRTRNSEFRAFEGTDDLPILQSTRLSRTPFTVGIRGYLRDRGRALSQFVWIPNDWTPYLGAGIGVMNYTFQQEGEFVDFDTLEIFEDIFTSTGHSLLFNVLGGVDVPIGPRFGLVGEAKYSWANADMDDDFLGFEEIDLSGAQATIGFLVRF